MRSGSSGLLVITVLAIILVCVVPVSAQCKQVGFSIVCDPSTAVKPVTPLGKGFEIVSDFVRPVKCFVFNTNNCGKFCVDLTSDPNNCGSCDNKCPAGFGCAGVNRGYPCPQGFVCPGNGLCCDPSMVCIDSHGQPRCTRLNWDMKNCGKCGKKCFAGDICSGGKCCPAGLYNCNDICVDLNTDRAHCGSCKKACSIGQTCYQGSCCPAGLKDCDGTCVNPNTDRANCGDCKKTCGIGQNCYQGKCCSPSDACPDSTGQPRCTDRNTDPTNCGTCGNKCQAGYICSGGKCCPAASPDVCSGNCVDLKTDSANCGTCGNPCSSGQNCYQGKCCALSETCPDTPYWVNGRGWISNTICTDTNTDPANCGYCGHRCGGDKCDNGVCCSPGMTNCGGTCKWLGGDPENCRSCGNKCDWPLSECNEGTCTCPGVWETPSKRVIPTLCNGVCTPFFDDPKNCGGCGKTCPSGTLCKGRGCECDWSKFNNFCPPDGCVDTKTNPDHCGQCSSPCPEGAPCNNGKCGDCPAPSSLCNLKCVDYTSDEYNCGSCGNKCPEDGICAFGSCLCPPGKNLCNGKCVVYNTDQNCGSCGNKCPSDADCVSGRCTCDNKQKSACPGESWCVDTSTDSDNCGICGTKCPYDADCVSGRCTCDNKQKSACPGESWCVNTLTDSDNCGICETKCASNKHCSSGRCV